MPASTTVKVPNYSDTQVARMREMAPLNKEKAETLAKEFGNGKTAKSVAAKAIREQIQYDKAPAPTKKAKDAPTKAQLVEAMRKATGLKLSDLEKAPTACLNEIARFINDALVEGEPDLDDAITE